MTIASALERYLETLPRQSEPGRELWCDANGQVQGQFFNCSLTSAFEPLVTLADRNVVAHEGSIRTYAEDGVGLAAWNLFAMAAEDTARLSLERLSRLVPPINSFAAE